MKQVTSTQRCQKGQLSSNIINKRKLDVAEIWSFVYKMRKRVFHQYYLLYN